MGELRRDPFAMLRFCGYNLSEYLTYWFRTGASGHSDIAASPKMFLINWFRKDADGRHVWPGYGESARVLRWIVERSNGTAKAIYTAIGGVPTAQSFGLDELGLSSAVVETLLSVDPDVWKAQAKRNRVYLSSLDDSISALTRQKAVLEQRLERLAAPAFGFADKGHL